MEDIVNKIESVIREFIPSESIFIDEPMKKHTTFRIGGPADILVKPSDIEQIKRLCEECDKESVPYIILGNGSNVLVSDDGIRGVVILLLDNYERVRVEGDVITAQAGARLSKIGSVALRASLSGFEFACGIPGTLGGACIMNAGAYGGEMKDILLSVTAMDKNGNIREYEPHEMGLEYRNSRFAKEGLIVLEAKIQLQKGRQSEIEAAMKDLAARRKEKQPLEFPSAGSTFKRPEGYFAGKLIMDAGLRGFSVGGACVSEKHCGFVVNKGEATAKDVCTLMHEVSDTVRDKFGVVLEPEVRIIGTEY